MVDSEGWTSCSRKSLPYKIVILGDGGVGKSGLLRLGDAILLLVFCPVLVVMDDFAFEFCTSVGANSEHRSTCTGQNFATDFVR